MEDRLHLSDGDIIMSIDGELRGRDATRVGSHLRSCWTCRLRKQELEDAIAQFVQSQQDDSDATSATAARAMLRQRMSAIASQETVLEKRFVWKGGSRLGIAAVAAVAILAVLVYDRFWSPHPLPSVVFAAPNPQLTPGVAVFEDTRALCNERQPRNKKVSVLLRKRVLDEYGIASLFTSAYEVDYLITPALGGTDDIHNLWPHSYSDTEWNATVKDALEDRLHSMVCAGELDLSTAQHEIASNWIEAYKKYFHTERPLLSAR